MLEHLTIILEDLKYIYNNPRREICQKNKKKTNNYNAENWN
jgi:hypothetical protein